MYDVPKEQYVTVIREMIRHENDLTNHRTMWLLIVQGLLANAYVAARGGEGRPVILMLSLVGILVTLSAFVMLYKSYQARGYLHFLGQEAKQGRLQEEYLPLDGWPKKRIKGWWRDVWVCPWLAQISDALEPWLFLPTPSHVHVAVYSAGAVDHAAQSDSLGTGGYPGYVDAFLVLHPLGLVSWEGRRGAC